MRRRGHSTSACGGTLREERADGDGEAGGRLFHVCCFSFPRAQLNALGSHQPERVP